MSFTCVCTGRVIFTGFLHCLSTVVFFVSMVCPSFSSGPFRNMVSSFTRSTYDPASPSFVVVVSVVVPARGVTDVPPTYPSPVREVGERTITLTSWGVLTRIPSTCSVQCGSERCGVDL